MPPSLLPRPPFGTGGSPRAVWSGCRARLSHRVLCERR